jgi:hypothetical protein
VNLAGKIIIALTSFTCLSALAISVYPGALNDLLFMGILLSPLIVPVVGLVLLSWYIVLARRGMLHEWRVTRTPGTIVLALLIATSVLLTLSIPRRIAFAAARDSFNEMLLEATSSVDRRVTVSRRLGVYTVDEFATDPRGGAYFRVHSGYDGLGPDVMSYGFAYQPNKLGTPFGAKEYRVVQLDKDWYWFCASDDWY